MQGQPGSAPAAAWLALAVHPCRRGRLEAIGATAQLATTPPSPAAPSPPLAAATMAPDWETALVRVREIQARFPGAANAAHQPRDPQELQEELDLFARLRSQFKGPPLTSAAIIAAIDRDSHPPEPPGLAAAGKVSH
jgi:hypothetical protein